MAKSDIELKFNLGKHILCVEAGHGYAVLEDDSGAPKMYDGVSFTIRERREKGQPGTMLDRQYDVKRSQILALALSMLDIASHMAVEPIWQRSETVGSGRLRPLWPLTKKEREFLSDLKNEEVKAIRKNVQTSYENLRRRVHILQRCQFVLERISDDSASQLDMMLTVLEQYGALPVRVEPGVVPNFEHMPTSETSH
ncbi:hypothetical protein [Pseudomonas aeruginosa]|uniref:hypothetical protein n=1 Tax=Pseudomonas aeruginosa TaxID=287 RepID=UPI001C89334E|nr:hypothetical protein [Pseudomonas aeruginosa]MBX5664478.1 hypothetical protein [Pseudomonas aeruginosa]MBX5682998.1 hypothetical protein [Pseudomonas aeruginosa]MBX5756607.1 hypothetical protein [Pseudomonas aeruginosa]MBX6077834.1 hypothetical protein [Pseudomonas aeruginosa]MBX6121788.1 hypothetical protein [Pseudomonas aeruginosa]